MSLCFVLCLFCVFLVFLYFTTRGSIHNNSRTGNNPVTLVTPAIPITAPSTSEATSPSPEKLFSYVEITDGCGPYFNGPCVNVRSGPGMEYPSVAKLRTGVVLPIENSVHAKDGALWYKISIVHELLYPERVTTDWYISAELGTIFTDIGERVLQRGDVASTTKSILVDRSEGKLSAFDGDKLFMTIPISIGLPLTPTPRGKFKIFRMTPSRYMQGPLPHVSDQYYDLPGVPWNLYFTHEGAVIHGAYWHDHFGEPWSHGCVNLPPQKAKELYYWADIGTPVTVRD